MEQTTMCCEAELAGLDPLRRCKVVEELLVGRLLRKSQRVAQMWESASRDWNETFYRMTAYAMGAPRNSEAFERLATRVSYLMCLKERSSLLRVEAMLLGTSGLLNGEYYDDYIVRLQDEFAYLANKYRLRGMVRGEWHQGAGFPAGNPVRRVAQMAALVSKDNYSVDELLKLRSLARVEEFFDVELGEYWAHRFAPDGKEGRGSAKMGRSKVYVMAINLVVPMLFAYGAVVGDDNLKEQAMDLLESIPAEHNHKVARWTGYGVPCHTAYDSQALIELSTYCAEKRCKECPLAKMRSTLRTASCLS